MYTSHSCGYGNPFTPHRVTPPTGLHCTVDLIRIPHGSAVLLVLVVIFLILRGVPAFPSLRQHIRLQDPSLRNRPRNLSVALLIGLVV